ncbi:LPXTG cell wall anchor domain-containing protein [Nocardioides sp. GY 10113]|uniref:neocarzinostatin apoprotein domain-containing protein n=1 Tax=Nocardioides sp. GY 10113 TaxID=2569761 RepID=UPI0010A88094|nr:neocarzinostatin apoprotein domain-containing protein [Nocardioides sp. GY 10113]TIC88054.1 LPXTG cell wall anchor domain-containing protein [Nocardioides sp. GY 10113]
MRNASTPGTRVWAKAALGAAALTVVAAVAAPPSFAAPSLNVSASSGLSDGQTVTISGGGFTANMGQIAVGQCIAGYTGPSDCNLQGGATFRNADAGGSIGSFSITVKQKFGSTDCMVQKCVIAAAPLPTAEEPAMIAANRVIIPITFGAPEPEPAPAATQTPATTTVADTAETTTATDDDELPQTGAADGLPMLAAGALGLLVVGGALRFGSRRTEGAR